MDRPTRHRRRFHTDRIVAKRRAAYRRAHPYYFDGSGVYGEAPWHRLTYGYLASRDPWDCGNPACGVCHPSDYGWRSREERAWRREWADIFVR
jgi:hypothetical protein